MIDGLYQQVDLLILDGIDKQRHQHQACTVGNLAASIRIAKSTVAERLVRMREAGLVTWSDNYAGSLQRVQTIDQRMRELVIIDAVEERAAQGYGGGGFDITEWCRELLAQAGTPVEDVVAAEPERTGDEPPVDGDSAEVTAATAGVPLETEWYCTLCDQPFKTETAMRGHQRASKVHLARASQQPGPSGALETVGAST